jgi:Uma2 family endonuclease
MEASLQPSRRLFSVAEYHRLGEAGVLTEDDRAELIEGEIIEMTPIGSLHAACVDRLTALFVPLVGRRAIVRVQNPVFLDDRSEPEPDLSLLRPRDDFYAAGHPGPGDVLLVVEVSDTSLEYDRKTKLPLYAAAGIAEAWIVDLAAGRLEVYSQPRGGLYTRSALYGREDTIASTAMSGLTVPVSDILG